MTGEVVAIEEEKGPDYGRLQWRILIGFVLGLLGGILVYTFARDAAWVEPVVTYVTNPLGQVFLRLLFMLVIPLIVSALVVGIADMGEIRALKKVGIRPVTEEFQNFGAMLAAERSKKIGALMFNSNSGVPNLARFQTLGKGSLNFYKTEDATLTKLMDEAALLPLDKAEAAWKKVYAHAAEIAWFAPVVASHTVYFASNNVKMPRIGQSIVVDVIDMVPAK